METCQIAENERLQEKAVCSHVCPLARVESMKKLALCASLFLLAEIMSPVPSLAKVSAEDKAILMVLSFPKVRQFSSRMAAKKQKVQAMAERKSKCVFNVRVFEDHPEHIVTFGFFNADICLGKVVEEE